MTWYRITGPDGEVQQVFRDGDDLLTGYPEADGYEVIEIGADLDDVEAARVEKWQAVKNRRDALESGVVETPAGPVQIDERSKTKINGVVLAATIALAAGAPFAEDFTMADNSVVTLDAEAAQVMGLAVAGFVSAAFAAARTLRDQIDAPGMSAADIMAIDIDSAAWPAGGE